MVGENSQKDVLNQPWSSVPKVIVGYSGSSRYRWERCDHSAMDYDYN